MIKTKANLIIAVISLVICLNADDSVLSNEFYTNHFTDTDVSNWTIGGNNPPSDHFFTECASERIFGGYKKFGGDSIYPSKISANYPSLIAHYGLRIQAKIYKIDSWNNENIFVMVDNVAAKIYTFGQTNSSSNLCGDPTHFIYSKKNIYNDSILFVDFNTTHTSPFVDVSFESDLNSDRGWWGIRDIKISLLLCDKSCLSCVNSSSCSTCDTSITGLTIVGAYCQCTAAATIKQRISNCIIMPCVKCIGFCDPGYYYSAITIKCEPCNIACAGCTGPMNTFFPACTTCAPGYLRTNPLTQTCFNCLGGCATCTALLLTACLSCKQGYFFHIGQCITSCPNGFFSKQSSRSCFPCSSLCNTCNGVNQFYCTSCTGIYYLTNTNQCLAVCNPPFFKYNNVCFQQCPVGTFQDYLNYFCVPCSSNCVECTNAVMCSQCNSGFYLFGGICQTSCPSTHYDSNITNQCMVCHSDCLTCNGSSSTSCLICSDATRILIKGVCYTSCPNSTYSSLCLSCHQTCLQCIGGSENQCIKCYSNFFLDLSLSKCVQSCQIGSIVDKINFTCSLCPNSMVGYFHQCVSCSSTCQTCYGTSFMECSTCDIEHNLFISTCLRISEPNIIKTSASSLQTSIVLTIVVVGIAALGLMLETVFLYKTPLLPTIEFIQILSFFYFLSVSFSEQVQRILLFFYYMNFTAILSVDFDIVAQDLPVKIQLMNKTGFYAIDTIGLHIAMLLAIILLLLLKKMKSLSRCLESFYQKLNPYLISYLYRIVILDQFFSVMLFLRYGSVQTFIGQLSLAIIGMDVIALAFTFFWKIKPNDRQGKQYALFYFNEIKEKYVQSQNQQINNSNNKKSLLLTFLFYVGKVPFVLAIVYFITNGTYQVISVLGYSLFFMIMMFILPYKRKIYRFLYLFGAILLLLSSALFVGVMSNQHISVALEVVWLLAFFVIFIITILQAAVNYQFFIHFFNYARALIYDYLTKESDQNSQSLSSELNNQAQKISDGTNIQQKNDKISDSKNQAASIKLQKPENSLDFQNEQEIQSKSENSNHMENQQIFTDTSKGNLKAKLKEAQAKDFQNQNIFLTQSPKDRNFPNEDRKFSDDNQIQLDFDL